MIHETAPEATVEDDIIIMVDDDKDGDNVVTTARVAAAARAVQMRSRRGPDTSFVSPRFTLDCATLSVLFCAKLNRFTLRPELCVA